MPVSERECHELGTLKELFLNGNTNCCGKFEVMYVNFLFCKNRIVINIIGVGSEMRFCLLTTGKKIKKHKFHH